MKLLGLEPAAIVGLIGTIVALVVSFGVKLSADQVGAIMAAVTALSGLLVRSAVTPVAKLPAPPPPVVPPAP